MVLIIAGVLVFDHLSRERQQAHALLALRPQLVAIATPLAEQRMVDEDPGGPKNRKFACAVEPLGTDPPGAEVIGQVETVYVWTLCATVGTPVRSESSAPMAMHLTNPIRVDMPVLGDNSRQIRRMFPKRLHDVIFKGIDGEDLDPALAARIRQIS